MIWKEIVSTVGGFFSVGFFSVPARLFA